MTTAAQAYDALRDRIDASDSGVSLAMRWQGEDGGPLPDTPTAFGYGVFENFGSRPGPISFGGGRSQNRYRNRAALNVYVFVPNGEGLAVGLAHAETIAARLRSHRDDDVSCFSADVIPVGDGAAMAPPGLQSEVENYFCVMVEADCFFDQIG